MQRVPIAVDLDQAAVACWRWFRLTFVSALRLVNGIITIIKLDHRTPEIAVLVGIPSFWRSR